MRLSQLFVAGVVFVAPTLAGVPSPALQALADRLSRDQCVQLYGQLSGESERLDRPCLPLLRRWNRHSGDAAALRDALRDIGQPHLADALTRGQDEQGAAAIADSLREVHEEAATEEAEAAEEELGEDSDDSESRPAGKDRPAEKDAFGAAGVTLLMTLVFLTAVGVCFCAGRAVCPSLAQYDPAARRRSRDSVSNRVNQMLRTQRLRGKMALVAGLTSAGGRKNSKYAPVPATEDRLSVSTVVAGPPAAEEELAWDMNFAGWKGHVNWKTITMNAEYDIIQLFWKWLRNLAKWLLQTLGWLAH